MRWNAWTGRIAEFRRREIEHLDEARGPVFNIRNDPRPALEDLAGFHTRVCEGIELT
jgi:hypothetical protein